MSAESRRSPFEHSPEDEHLAGLSLEGAQSLTSHQVCDDALELDELEFVHQCARHQEIKTVPVRDERGVESLVTDDERAHVVEPESGAESVHDRCESLDVFRSAGGSKGRAQAFREVQ